MKNLTVIAVAFAAGLTSFAAHAKDGAAKTAEKAIEATASTKEADKAADDVVTTGSIGGKAKAPYGEIVERYASSYGVPVKLAHAVISVESNYKPNIRGKAGEIGLMQIKPATARMMGYSGSAKGLFNPETNIKFGMKYLAKAHALGGGSTCGTILKYNAGHGAKRMNPISAAYCKKVQARIGSK
ncbi:lytic transglycosylase domain-containing protein [Mesorhizobium sp. ANAO-SY3R2]|uniref:lytic transglycosylase domain-containing protein n=1 Tax=Mesorhizobium sp. ANAO-SY3R2 TaxID=3166644 RepID=UPI00366E6D18